MNNYRYYLGRLALPALLLTGACESRQSTRSELPAGPPVADTARAGLVPTPLLPPDTTDASRTGFGIFRAGRDTTFYVGQQRYRLLLRAETDSTKPLLAVTAGNVGSYFASDSATFAQTGQVRGYEGFQLITLLDSVGRTVFRQRLRKADFFGVASPDIVTVSEPQPPVFLGFHGPSQRLAFSIDIGIPYSDVAQRVVLLLGFDGKKRRLFTSYRSNWGAPDCVPRLLSDGTLLTCQELVPPAGPRVPLLKPRAELVAAFPLTDTTLFTAYRYGQYRPAQAPESRSETPADLPVEGAATSPGFVAEEEWVPDATRRHAPNAFVISARGQIRRRLLYGGYEGSMSYEIPRRYVWQTHTYYLLDGKRGLIALDKHPPGASTAIPFRQMQPFRRPRKPTEIRFQLGEQYIFYLDPHQPALLRYEQRPEAEGEQRAYD